jgi:hypothetical protein
VNLVITTAGLTLFHTQHLSMARQRFHIAYLWGSPEVCLRSVLDRERDLERGLCRGIWLLDNERVFFWLTLPFNKPLLIDAFTDSGDRRRDIDILHDLEQLMAQGSPGQSGHRLSSEIISPSAW